MTTGTDQAPPTDHGPDVTKALMVMVGVGIVGGLAFLHPSFLLPAAVVVVVVYGFACLVARFND